MKIIKLLDIFLLFSQLCVGQSRAKKIDSISQIIHSKNPEVAISIGFIDHGKEYFFNYGTLSKTSSKKVNETTIYEIGSITKLLTANLIAQAQLEGRLAIDDPIGNYFPSKYKLPKNILETIKISDLGSHQSGLPDFDFQKLMKSNPKQPLAITDRILHDILNDSTSLIDYGNYRYSNISYTILGLILEKVYNKDFDQILQEKIVKPAKLKNTLTKLYHVENRVTGYDIEEKKQDYFIWNHLTAPAGLLKSNTKDMVKFIKVLISGKNQIAAATKLTERTFYKNTRREIGLGQEMARDNEDLFFYKTGDTFACSSILTYDKKFEWGMVILVNQHNSDLIRDLINTNYEAVLKPN